MVELSGQMKDNLLVDFGIAKKTVKDVVNVFDHKFFVNKKYVESDDEQHYAGQVWRCQRNFQMQVPKNTTYLLEGEATVENLSMEIIKLLAEEFPSNVEAIGVYIYEGDTTKVLTSYQIFHDNKNGAKNHRKGMESRIRKRNSPKWEEGKIYEFTPLMITTPLIHLLRIHQAGLGILVLLLITPR